MRIKNKKGITLIALVITIIILLLLAGITITQLTQNGLIRRTQEARFKTNMAEYRDEVNMYVSWRISENMNTNTKTINSGEVLKSAIEQEIIYDITKDDVTINIEEILKEIKKEEKEYIVVYKGEMYYVSRQDVKNNKEQEKWCEEIGIKILKYVSPEGVVVRNGNYEKVNGVYLCTPKLDEGFKEEYTRYLEPDGKDHLVPGKWISGLPSNDWYNYKESKWANIYVEEGGIDYYYVWIPRYCFILNQNDERADVKFIDCENNYKDAETDEVTTWKELEKQGYQVPEAFTFSDKELPGYWAMKYTAGDITKPSTINYDMSVTQGVVTIKNITINTSVAGTRIKKYTFALNGMVDKTKEISDTQKIENISQELVEFSNLKEGNNTINVTALDENGEIVGSMTKEYAPAVVNKPDLDSFDKETTYYVTYDSNGNEDSTIPISEKAPQYWYEYGESRWANIVTRINGQEIYYTWIPRYQFKLDQTNERSIIKFVQGTSTETEEGYQIPEAFTFNNQELTGFWAMKYTAGDTIAPKFDTEVVATSSSIKTKGITGTGVEETGQVYNYYIDGKYQETKTNASDTFEYTGLGSKKKYTILVEVRKTTKENYDKGEYVGTIVKQISTIEANAPDLSGFDETKTYYVTYDDSGNEIIKDKIKKDLSNKPNNWYDYSKSNWANIVVTDGTISNGKIVNATNTIYYTWIPRYEFMITDSQYKQIEQGRIEVRFIEETSTETDEGYQIPEAFTFNNQELTGFWAMKYTAGN